MTIQDLPSWIQLDITNRCNLTCAMCPRKQINLNEGQLSLELFSNILARLRSIRIDMLSLTGIGEPFMHQSLFQMVKAAKEIDIPISITTNGHLLNQDNIERIIESKVDCIRVSIDQVSDIDREVLHPFSLEVLNNVRNIIGARKALGIGHPSINLTTVVSQKNLHHIKEVINWTYHNGVDYLQLQKLSTRFNKQTNVPLALEEMYFKEWHDYAKKLNYDLRSTYLSKDETECAFLSNYLMILQNGDVSPCCHLRKYIIGNILECSIEQIWNGNKMQTFRGKWLDICGGCNLMMWNYHQAKH